MRRTRREFTAAIKRAAFARSGGLCECARVASIPGDGAGCGVRLTSGSIFFEHIQCDALDGAPTLENCAVLTKTCWRIKTDRVDLPTIAKANRVRDRNAGIMRTPQQVLLGTFRSGVKLPMDGSGPIVRETGRPLHARRDGR